MSLPTWLSKDNLVTGALAVLLGSALLWPVTTLQAKATRNNEAISTLRERVATTESRYDEILTRLETLQEDVREIRRHLLDSQSSKTTP